MSRSAIIVRFVAAVLSASGACATAAHAGQPASSASVTRLSVLPPWFTQSAGGARGNTTISFELRRAGTVVFTVKRVAPRCADVAAFRVRGRAGENRFLFPGRLPRRLFPPGTYHVEAPAGRGRAVRLTLASFGSDSTDEEVERALARNVCGASPDEGRVPAATSVARGGEGSGRRTATIACLAIAIALLGAAAWPLSAASGPRTAELLAAYRPALAFAGVVALAAGASLYVATLL